MNRRVPVVATIIVAIAVATMIALGFWQIGRARERDADYPRHLARSKLPTIAYPFDRPAAEEYRFRRLRAPCDRVVRWDQRAGKSAAGEAGWSYVATCAAGEQRFEAELGFSTAPNARPSWPGGEVVGHARLGPDRRGFGDRLLWRSPRQALLIVSETPAAGLEASQQPAAVEETNSSWSYAVQWFLFAATALVIYAIALRRRWRERADKKIAA